MSPEIGKLLIALGAIILIAGILLFFLGDKFGWLGNLPGDVRIESGNSRVYFPIVSMIILSIILTVVINLFRRLF